MLKISKLTDYATVVMSYLAREPEQIASAVQIANAIHLTIPTVSKLLKILCGAGLVVSFRGAEGGYKLARPIQQITVAEIVAAIEGDFGVTECCHAANACVLDSLCGIKDNWKIINKIIFNTLKKITLHDMVHSFKKNSLTLNDVPLKLDEI